MVVYISFSNCCRRKTPPTNVHFHEFYIIENLRLQNIISNNNDLVIMFGHKRTIYYEIYLI